MSEVQVCTFHKEGSLFILHRLRGGCRKARPGDHFQVKSGKTIEKLSYNKLHANLAAARLKHGSAKLCARCWPGGMTQFKEYTVKRMVEWAEALPRPKRKKAKAHREMGFPGDRYPKRARKRRKPPRKPAKTPQKAPKKRAKRSRGKATPRKPVKRRKSGMGDF